MQRRYLMKLILMQAALALLIGAGPSGLVACTPSPSQQQNPQGSQSYALPLVVTAVPECGEAEQVLYRMEASGRFEYLPQAYNPFDSEAPSPVLQSKNLSSAQLEQTLALLQTLNLAQKFAESEPVPADAPQTMECRTVLHYQLQVNGSAKTYDANGRRYHHSEAYRQAMAELEQHLQQLSTTATAPETPHYGLALKVLRDNECGGPDPAERQQVEYAVSTAGELSWHQAETAGAVPQTGSRPLARQEIQELGDLLQELDLQTQYQAQEKIPEDAPQTRECRMIEVLELDVNGETLQIEGQSSRKIRPAENYLAAIARLKARLMELSQR